MEIQLLLLFLIKSVICSQQNKTIHFDITFEKNQRVKCTPRDQSEKLSFGDQFQIIAHLPYEADRSNDVAHMWCNDGEKNILEKCTTKTHQRKSTCEANEVYNIVTNGRWNCTYLIMKDFKQIVEPRVLFNSNYYTQVDCILNVDTQAPLRFSKLDPNRLKITNKTLYNATYEYIYGDKEKLYVECIGPENKQSTILYKSKSMTKELPVGPFSMSAGPGLDGATLTCTFKNERSSYDIKITLIAGYIRFTGLKQIEWITQQDNIYTYRQNEDVQIGCNSNLPCKTDLRFHEAGTGANEFQRQSEKFYYKFSGSGLSGQYLLCTCNYSDKCGPMEIKLTFEPEKLITTTVSNQLDHHGLTTTTTTMRVVTTPQTKPRAGFDISMSISKGPSSMILSDAFKKYYIYEYTSEDEITLTCTSKFNSTKNRSPTINRKLQIANTEYPEQKTSEKVTFNRITSQHQIKHTFKIHGNGTIVCSSIDEADKNPPKPMTATVQYIFIPPTETPTTTNPPEIQPHQPLSNTDEKTTPEHVQPAQENKLEGDFLKQNFTVILGVGAAVVVMCAGICAVMVFKKKSAAPDEDNYVNLENNQHSYNTLPVPASQIQRNPPTVEANYSEPKDSNDMSDAVYADPNRFRETTTYAEPYIQRSYMYAKPIPKSQRKPKNSDDPNYSNIFGKDYVNSSKK